MEAEMNNKNWPFVSILIPTFNAEKDLSRCLENLMKQTYPKDRYEIIIADGGSSDNSVEIAKEFGCRVVTNPYHFAEEGKAVALKYAKGEIIGLIDADNEIVQSDWLEKLVEVLEKEMELVGIESNWILRPEDPLVNRYCCLIRLEDPLFRQIGMLSRCAYAIDKGDYLIWVVKEGKYPSIGANGFLWQRKVLDLMGPINSFDESDLGARAFSMGINRIGNVKGYGIYHHHSKTLWDFFRKRYRQPHLFFERKVRKSTTWLDRYSRWEFIKGVLYCISFVGPTIEAIKGYRESGDIAWFLHPFMAAATILIYFFTYAKLYLKWIFSHRLKLNWS